MGRATLSYYIDDKKFVIFSDLLFNIDKYTSEMKNERELFESIPKDEFFSYYLKNSKKKGAFKVSYIDKSGELRILPVLYNEKSIQIDDIPQEGIISESERARRYLLNSEEQLYSKLFVLNTDLDPAKKYSVIVSKQDKRLLEKNGIKTFIKGDYYAVSIEDLIRYRSTHKKLRDVRTIYEEALDIWKSKMETLPYDEIYYLSRQYRLIGKYYNRIREDGLSINNLYINKSKLGMMRNRIKVDTITPILEEKNKPKNKVMKSIYQ